MRAEALSRDVSRCVGFERRARRRKRSRCREPMTMRRSSVAADEAQHWQQGVYDVWHLRGNCRVRQGETDIRGPEAVLWIDATIGDPEQPRRSPRR